MTKTINFFLFIAVAFSFEVFSRTEALTDCSHLESDHPQKAKKYLMCLDGNIEQLERNRQTWITKLIMDTEELEKNTGNTQLMPIIQRGMLNQSRYMDDACKWRYLKELPNSTRAAKVFKRCKISFLQQHIKELQTNF
ncbi:hypothetical protein [Pseudoalteromonas luteoviolacea]|uniref:Lysozyme inhibitor LprI N-terminal domain-containing protein n=1 Tax=Pseudoalteromonas luteoviolacea S4054 TaxID=1129367 RepID=A0A0F6A4Q3_9GAMM|nr:hypothetical protein [Pseudoalteromonas luteoviolacea]AOT08960.1 hypothetical protein S4054249_14295 [Pseudoalteromonas luteoviolacea]AOT13872.1 hypothetical protein S40542_14265 [Pseudoalteromonas luteoviolacea]AOT18787.1 hypothetical protein S4054_14270 [Pseudoalteromonas luteoviolacea]KKE80841.1 hypothetical protein N479_03970 [Pseudoalteromonas luteoviolacea S4054]KZN71025.1 hypothetical protein N481_20165 [Pseudoalteromonas luteoviolacea S4047-1]